MANLLDGRKDYGSLVQSSNTGKDLINKLKQPSRKHAFVSFNNQASILMAMPVRDHKLLCLMHDNRIFAFKRDDDNENQALLDSSSSSITEQNVILNLLTTAKYRAMSAMYIIFRLLDNISFISLIVLTILNKALTLPSAANISLLTTIGLEVFYDVMLQTNKYWILERLSFYIGIILYTVYTGIVIWKNSRGDYSQYDLEIVEGVLGARFIAFLLEEFVDIAIDGELHNDLSKLQKIKEDPVTEKKVIVKIEEENTSETEAIEHEVENKNKKVIYSGSIIELKKYMDVSNFVAMPNSVNYYGSFFCVVPILSVQRS